MSRPPRPRKRMDESTQAHWQYVRQCLRKRRYATARDAQCVGCKVYRCPWCDGYHRATDPNYKRGR